MQYITPSDLQAYSRGVSTTGIGSTELGLLIDDAGAEVDSYCKTTYMFQRNVGEQHDWMQFNDRDSSPVGKQSSIFPYNQPVRKINSLTIGVSIDQNGNMITMPIPVTPVVSPVSFGLLPPNVIGQCWIDHDVGYITPVYILLQFGLFAAYPAFAKTPPSVQLDYYSGYDDPLSSTLASPVAQADGYAVPIPKAFNAAARQVCVDILTERELGVMGMAGLVEARGGPSMARRGTGPGNQNMYELSKAARDKLTPFRLDGMS